MSGKEFKIDFKFAALIGAKFYASFKDCNSSIIALNDNIKKNLNDPPKMVYRSTKVIEENKYVLTAAVYKRGKRLVFKNLKKESLATNNASINTRPVATSENNSKPTPSESILSKAHNNVKYFDSPTQTNASTETKLAGAVTTSRPQTVGEKVTSFKNNPSAWLAEQWKDTYLNWVDKNHLAKEFDKKHEKAIGRKLEQHEKLYGRVQGITSSANGTSDVLIGGGREELAGLNQRLQNTKLKHPNGTMKQVLENVKEDVLDNASNLNDPPKMVYRSTKIH